MAESTALLSLVFSMSSLSLWDWLHQLEPWRTLPGYILGKAGLLTIPLESCF